MSKNSSAKSKSRPAGRLYRVRVVGMSQKEISRIGRLEKLLAQLGKRVDQLEIDQGKYDWL